MNGAGENNSLIGGIRVLDLADEKASYCSKLLADMGACVIKVEKPGGDASRGIGPFWKDLPHPEKSLFFWYNNREKDWVMTSFLQFYVKKPYNLLYH